MTNPDDFIIYDNIKDDTASRESTFLSMAALHWKSKSVILVCNNNNRPELEILSRVFSVTTVSDKCILADSFPKSADAIIVSHVNKPLWVSETIRRKRNFEFTPIIVIPQSPTDQKLLLESGATVVMENNSSSLLLTQCQSLLWSTHFLAVERANIELSPSPILVLNEIGHIVTCNQAAQLLLEIKDVNSLSSSILENILLLPERQTLNVSKLTELAQKNATIECEYNRAGNTSLSLVANVSFVVLREGILFSLLIRDISKEKAIEKEQQERKNEAIHTEKMLMLGELASHVAHEINNPLAVIQARISLLQDTISDETLQISAEIKNSFSQKMLSIEKSATRIQRIVRSLYRFSRNESEEEFDSTPVLSVIEDTIDLCSARFANHGVALELPHVSPELRVYCRPLQISQILLNLLTNAFDALTEKHDLQATDRWVILDIVETEKNVEFWVSNGGPKIPHDVATKIFVPYFTTKPVGKGTGLGLSISRSLAHAHGGDLYLKEDAPNTCFVCVVPKEKISA